MAIQIGRFSISWYGLFIVLGIFAGAVCGYVLMHIHHLEYDRFIQTACFAGLGAMTGAKILYLAVIWETIDFSELTDPEYVNSLMAGGFVYYGGLLGAAGGLYVCKRVLRINVEEYVCAAVPVLPLAHGFGRIGCAFAGCCYGIPYEGPGAVVYKASMIAPAGIPLFPVQALEAAGNFLICIILCLYGMVCRRKRIKSRAVSLYLLLYASFRFLLEFLRYDDQERGSVLGVSTSQWISIALILTVIIFSVLRRKNAGLSGPA